MRIELAQRNGDVVLAIADDGGGIDGARRGDGAVDRRALVRDELGGTLSLEADGGLAPRWCFRHERRWRCSAGPTRSTHDEVRGSLGLPPPTVDRLARRTDVAAALVDNCAEMR